MKTKIQIIIKMFEPLKSINIGWWLLVLILLVNSSSSAQSVINVEPGDGTLSDAISTADSFDVLQLQGGGIYTITSESTFGEIKFPLSIQVEPEATEKAILQLGSGASTSKKYYFFEINNGAALTLKGLEIHGLLNENRIASSMLIFDGRPNPAEARIGNFVFEDCVFHDFKDYVIHGMKDSYARGMIQDSVFVNDVIVYNAKHFLQYKHVSLRHLEMTNSTIYDLSGMALKIGKIGYRCVLENPGKPYIPVTDETITPTGFIDHCTLNNLGDIHGHIQVDEAYHRLKISNCIISNQQQFKQPPVYFNEALVDSAGIFSNTCFWNTAGFSGINAEKYIFNDTIHVNPVYKNAAEADFSIPFNSALLTYGKDGGIIGDPRWKTYATDINDFSIQQNLSFHIYPNPVKKNLYINYSLKSESQISIKIFNINGIEIENLLNEKKQAGTYTLEWNSTNNDKGIYLCQIISGINKQSKKLVIK